MTDDERREALLEAMSLEEKASLTGGDDVWHLPAVDRLGLGRLKMSDGPSGVRGQHVGTRRALSFPCGMAAGASWDTALMERYGAALAEEAKAKGVHLLLGPTVCIPRTPLAGRTFESFSEDPHLSARLTVAYVRGVQAGGVGCCVKHFACNDQEHERMSISAEVDARTLREIHLPAFEAAVREASVHAVMSAYNRVNGVFCGEHPELLGEILKDEWGFDGIVVSDWFGTHSTVPAAAAGLDVEMPGPPRHLGGKLAAAVASGDLDESVLDEQVRRILRLASRAGLLDHPPSADEPQDPEDPGRHGLSRELAVAGTVLLRNDGVLPITPSVRSIAVIGPNADRIETGGGGSSQVVPHRVLSFVDELRGRVRVASVSFERGCDLSRGVPTVDPTLLGEGLRLDFHADDLDGEVVGTDVLLAGRYLTLGDPLPGLPVTAFGLRARASFRPDVSGEWQLALTSAGASRLLLDGEVVLDNMAPTPGDSFFGLGSTRLAAAVPLEAETDHEVVVELLGRRLPLAGFEVGAARPREDDLVERAVAAAEQADVAIVVVGSNSQWETEGADRADLRLVGDQDELVERVLGANPRTVVVLNSGAPVEMPWADRTAALLTLWYPGEDGAPALADVLTGAADPGGRLPITFPRRLEDTPTQTDPQWYPGADGKVVYGEGLSVGYRHYDSVDVEPAFPFGHGLSYGTYDYSELTVEVAGHGATVTVPVTNSGDRPGTEVVQLYVRDVEASVDRPPKELKAFAKVRLEPGEASDVRLDVDERAFAYWDESTAGWVVEPGEFELLVGRSSRDLRQRVTIELRS